MTASPSAGERRKFLANTIKPGGVAGVPESYYRKALDLNRFSNSVANKLLESYRRQISQGHSQAGGDRQDAQQQKTAVQGRKDAGPDQAKPGRYEEVVWAER